MKIVEQKVSAGDAAIFDLDEFLSRPLYAHLAHLAEGAPRESPVWFHWDRQAIWIIGGTSFPTNLKREPRCALGIVDWDPASGRSQHVGLRGSQRRHATGYSSTRATAYTAPKCFRCMPITFRPLPLTCPSFSPSSG
jgi:hypothetical protein